MIEFGEPVHLCILGFMAAFVIFLLGSMWGNVSAEK